MMEKEVLLKDGTVLVHCRTLAKKIEVDRVNKKLVERNRKFKFIQKSLTDRVRIENRIARAIVDKKRSCPILKVRSCPCLSLGEIKLYARAYLPDLGREFKIEIRERIESDERSYTEYIEVRIGW